MMLKLAVHMIRVLTLSSYLLMYGSDIWALRKAEQVLVERTENVEMDGGIKRIEKIRIEEMRARASVANISETTREARLRWLGHVERKSEEEVSGHGTIRIPKMRWREVIQEDMKEKGVQREEAQDQTL